MPEFRSTKDIFLSPWNNEVYNENFMDKPFITMPETFQWDYKRELKIEDVDIWEVIFEGIKEISLYVSWKPYAEFYMIVYGSNPANTTIETFYGIGASKQITEKTKLLGINLKKNKIYIPDDIYIEMNKSKNSLYL